jgi:hypothetical protein
VRFFKSKTRFLAWGALLAAILLGTSHALLYDSPAWRFSRAYGQLQLGMTENDVRELLGATPDFECRYRSYRIWYYRVPDFLAGDFDEVQLDRGVTVSSLADLPDVYDHIQLAIDASGRLHAFTWIGESYTVESMNGSVRGSHFSRLSPSDF